MSQNDGRVIVFRPELGSTVRLDGRFEGPKKQTLSIWKARPPVLEDGSVPPTLFLSADNGPGADAPVGSTVTIYAEGAAAGGGRASRLFEVGHGLTAELLVGYFKSITVVTKSPVPAGLTLYFTWSFQIAQSRGLVKFLNYPAPAVPVNLPEGCETVVPELACLLTFILPQFGTTFAYSASAGEAVPALWGAMSCNIPNKFVFRLKPL
jgi:hypothetical protein